MTIQEIGLHLKKYHSLTFRYGSMFYSIQRRRFFRPVYSLIATDGIQGERHSLEELCEQVSICDDTLLSEAIKHIEIPEWQDPAWETYEAVRHSAIIYGNEVRFQYRKRWYWITYTNDGFSYLSNEEEYGNAQCFSSCRDLFEKARIDGNSLKDIWGEVEVDAC